MDSCLAAILRMDIRVMCPECGEFHYIDKFMRDEMSNGTICEKCLDEMHDKFVRDMAELGLDFS